MQFVLVVKLRLDRPFDHWVSRFDAHRDARAAAGIVDIFRHPVIGEQAVVYAVRTADPRAVHDMIYDPDHRPGIEESGFVIGSEQILVCEAGV
jgi:hypothetical protein